jgi:hypothetical protein
MFESGEKSMELREPMHSPSAGKASSCAVVGSRQSPMEKDKLRIPVGDAARPRSTM